MAASEAGAASGALTLPDDVNADFVHTVNDVGHFLGAFWEPNTNTHRETGHMPTRAVGSGD